MTIEWIWVITTISILFLLWFVYRIGYSKGRRDGFTIGAEQVLAEWRQTLEIEGDDTIG